MNQVAWLVWSQYLLPALLAEWFTPWWHKPPPPNPPS